MDNGASSYRRFLSGDDNGIIEIIKDYRDGLLLYLCGITGNAATAEEIAEETFFRLAVKKPRFREKSSFKTWLYAIARNVAIDLLRKERRYSHAPIEDYAALSDDEADLERHYLKEEQQILLHRAMRRLSTDYRQVLFLSYFEGLSNEEAARVMKRSKRQIENLLSRARKALRNELSKEGLEKNEIL